MVNKKRYAHFQPDPEQLARWPDISGNTINGLGEPESRHQ